ncbi:MAG: superoxide dismutase family protein [Burkholderiales bacterium]
MKTKTVFAVFAAATLLAACQTTPPEPPRATAQLKPLKGSKVFGEANFEQRGDKVHISAVIQGLKPGGEYGFHIHEVGDCSGDGTNAKGHFNPFGSPHGHYGYSRADRHAGDLPSLRPPAKKNRRGRVQINDDIEDISLEPGPANIIGRSIIVHARPDDFKTQPTGNAGARLACGIIRAQ